LWEGISLPACEGSRGADMDVILTSCRKEPAVGRIECKSIGESVLNGGQKIEFNARETREQKRRDSRKRYSLA